MKSNSQSPREARRPNILPPTRRPISIGTCNVCTMYEAGKCVNLGMEMKSYSLHILGLNDTRWTVSDQTKLASGETIMYSGHEEVNSPHTQGGGIMLSKQAEKAPIGWEPVCSRIIAAKFRTSNQRISLKLLWPMQQPTMLKKERRKPSTENCRTSSLEIAGERERVILIGDFRCQGGNVNSSYSAIMRGAAWHQHQKRKRTNVSRTISARTTTW